MKDPRTSAVLNELMDDKGEIHEGNCPEKLVKLARQLELELAQERKKIWKLRVTLQGLAIPCTCADYTTAKLDEIVCGIARKALEETK